MHGQSHADGRSHRLFDEIYLSCAGMGGAVFDGPFFHFRDARRHGYHYPRSDQFAVLHPLDEVPEHRLGNLEVRDDAVLHRADGHDVARGASQHPLGFFAYGQDVGGAGLNGHDGRLPEHDAFIPHVNERVGGAQVNSNVVGKQAFNLCKHESA